MGYCAGCRDLDTRNHFAVAVLQTLVSVIVIVAEKTNFGRQLPVKTWRVAAVSVRTLSYFFLLTTLCSQLCSVLKLSTVLYKGLDI